MFLHSLEETVYVFADVLGIIFFDDFLEGRFVVVAVGGDFGGCRSLEQSFDTLEVVLYIRESD